MILWDDRVAWVVVEGVFITVQGETGVVVVSSDGRFGTLGFASPDVEEAELVPDESADVRFQGVEAEGFAVSVEAHTFGHADGGADEDRVSARHFFSA